MMVPMDTDRFAIKVLSYSLHLDPLCCYCSSGIVYAFHKKP